MRIDIENNIDVEMMEFDHLLYEGESYKITGWYDDGTVEAELDRIDGMLMEHHYLRNILNDIDTW